MNYREAIQFLYGLQLFGARFGLETPRRLASLAGNPQDTLRFIHVAGTNGKGSTCAMLESIYRHAGLRVGLFTSPHLVSFAERIQVNRVLIPEADVARLVTEMQPWLKEFNPETHPTFFEVVTVMALRWFAEQRCELVIWETGLGGRLDATNIVTPLASVITNIGWDHQQWLGDTLDKIAAEKAGIIKAGVPVITAAEPGRGLEVIAQAARSLNASLTVIPSKPDRLVEDPQNAEANALRALPLAGSHQRRNARLALATARRLAHQIPVSEDAVVRGLATVHWAGRMQVVTAPDGRKLVLDGAHNPDGASALRATVAEEFPGARPALVLGVLADKDWPAIVQELAPMAGRILVVPVSSARTVNAAELGNSCQAANPNAPVSVCGDVKQALAQVAREPLTVITGSLYLIGEALERLGSPASPEFDERGLNEWTGSPR